MLNLKIFSSYFLQYNTVYSLKFTYRVKICIYSRVENLDTKTVNVLIKIFINIVTVRIFKNITITRQPSVV